MKRWISIAWLVCVSGCMSQQYCDRTAPSQNCPPPPPREFRAVWVATVGNIDWPSKPGLPVVQQKQEMLEILDRAKSLNMNAIILQVRTSCDAMYPSPYEPWSYYLTGEQGKAPQPMYDPLQTWIEESHKRGMELHAWFNPFRAKPGETRYQLAASHIANRQPSIVKQYGPVEWLDPGEPAAQEYTLKVMEDVVKRYDVDGIHIDDYFYPYREKDKATGKELDFPDAASWGRYQKSGGKLSRDDWRRENINQLVEQMYVQTKKIKPWVKVGISPFGVWRPGNPPSVHGFDAYQSIYCDSKLWLQKGWVDYFTPQIYWGMHEGTKPPFGDLLAWWMQQDTTQRHIWPGLYTGRIKAQAGGRNNWSPQVILDQIAAARALGANGQVHFSMKCLMKDNQQIDEVLRDGPYAQPALVPATPWLDKGTPAAPMFSVRSDSEYPVVAWKDISWFGKSPWLWVVSVRYQKGWKSEIEPGTSRELALRPDEKLGQPLAVTVSAVDRLGAQSRPTEAITLMP
jgi:uncharacterized lipoprotein YddW (UPF0748 family)